MKAFARRKLDIADEEVRLAMNCRGIREKKVQTHQRAISAMSHRLGIPDAVADTGSICVPAARAHIDPRDAKRRRPVDNDSAVAPASNTIVNVVSADDGSFVCTARLGESSNFGGFTDDLESSLMSRVNWAQFWTQAENDIDAAVHYCVRAIQICRKRSRAHVFVDDKPRKKFATMPLLLPSTDPLAVLIIDLQSVRAQHAQAVEEKKQLLQTLVQLERDAAEEMHRQHIDSVPFRRDGQGDKYILVRSAQERPVNVTIKLLSGFVRDAVTHAATHARGNTGALVSAIFNYVRSRERNDPKVEVVIRSADAHKLEQRADVS